MKIKNISFINYRNLQNDNLIIDNDVNVIYGDNAQGKTNLLELIWLFTGGKSFRGAKDRELIKFGENQTRISLDFLSLKRHNQIKINFNSISKDVKKTICLNDVLKKSSSEIIGSFLSVVFSPSHLSLVKNGPLLRRNFIDAAICQLDPSYPFYLSKYNKILNHRNVLIKNSFGKTNYLNSQFDVWDYQLSSVGTYIINKRLDYCNKLKNYTDSIYKDLCFDNENLSINYKMSFECNSCIIDDYYNSLCKKRSSDINLGFTTVGCHRDDLIVKINDMNAKNFASQGQQRFIVLALKLAEAKILEDVSGEKPVVLLDDVLSELDKKRQKYLLDNIGSFQVFITCCELNDLIKNSNAKIFKIKSGAFIT
ncbi:MAG: DNA replication/repair protein RecF [Clostridia bacterium]|nr:DNA replication/repair protein RecF [Clostridia bacterium]